VTHVCSEMAPVNSGWMEAILLTWGSRPGHERGDFVVRIDLKTRPLGLASLLFASFILLNPTGFSQAKSAKASVKVEAKAPRLVFRSNRGGAGNGLYLANADGTNVKQLVENLREVLGFQVNPRGDRIALICDPDDMEQFELTVLHLETKKEQTIHRGIRLAPRWSRDGKRLAFMHYSSKWRIRITNPDVLIERPKQKHIGGDGAPSWFPGDKKIVFQSNRTGLLELFVADTITGKATQLTKTKNSESSPSISPDGKWIAYRQGSALCVVPKDGKPSRNLTKDLGKVTGYGWSPDSSRLVVGLKNESNIDLFVLGIKPNASPLRLTKHKAEDYAPVWSPDGKRIAFTSERDGDAEVYTISDLGKDLRRVTKNKARDRSPQWLVSP
jgi:Tol biopolymer transport system component